MPGTEFGSEEAIMSNRDVFALMSLEFSGRIKFNQIIMQQ